MGSKTFAGFKWETISTLEAGSEREQQAAYFFQTAAWDAVRRVASELRDERACELDSSIGLGGRHMIRVVRFDDGIAWIARIRMPANDCTLAQQTELMQREIDCLRFVRQKSNVPVPFVYGHNLQDTARIGAPTMFIECLQGNVAMDLNFNSIPSEYKGSFLQEMARLQTEIAALRLQEIGTIVQLHDGSFTVGPIAGLGGPFATATAYFEAWGERTQFPHSASRIRSLCGPHGDEVLASTEGFPPKVRRLAQQLSACDSGPFPLCHGDFGHNNIVVDDQYQVLGVIDWEDACTAPWETIEYPLILRVTPRSIDLPSNWDEEGNSTDTQVQSIIDDQQTYLGAVRDAEAQTGLASMLSATLGNMDTLGLATSMRLFSVDGKMGWYSRALDYIVDSSQTDQMMNLSEWRNRDSPG